MAHSRTARKRVRQNETHRARNKWRKNSMREALKDFQDKVLHGSVADATTAMRKVARIIDRSAAKGVIHKNQAARRKSRLAARLKAKAKAK